MNKETSNTARATLLTSMATVVILSFGALTVAHADHAGDTSTWSTDRTFYIKSSLNGISHASFTPATDFEDAADVWNDVSSSWWDFTRDDTGGDVGIGATSFGWFATTLAETFYYKHNGVMYTAYVDFNTSVDFRDLNVSQGWWSYDYETVAIHEIGHVAGIHGHTGTAGSPMISIIPTNTVDRTLNSHDIATIGGMY